MLRPKNHSKISDDIFLNPPTLGNIIYEFKKTGIFHEHLCSLVYISKSKRSRYIEKILDKDDFLPESLRNCINEKRRNFQYHTNQDGFFPLNFKSNNLPFLIYLFMHPRFAVAFHGYYDLFVRLHPERFKNLYSPQRFG